MWVRSSALTESSRWRLRYRRVSRAGSTARASTRRSRQDGRHVQVQHGDAAAVGTVDAGDVGTDPPQLFRHETPTDTREPFSITRAFARLMLPRS